MSKLKLRPACYQGLAGVKRKELKHTEKHVELVKEANKKIDESKAQRATAYKNASSYLGS